MNLSIGKKIKELRKSNDITQEKLADYLGISYQAVSKWENGTALPDITLLPPLANFFGVSINEFFDIEDSSSNKKINEYESIGKENQKYGKIFENIELWKNALKEFPRNYQFMINLSYALTQYNATKEQEEYSKNHSFIEEAILLCERILEDCTTESIRQSAIQILCYNYPKAGKIDKAIELAIEMPEMLLSKEALLSHIYKDENKIKQNQENLLQMIDYCAGILVILAFNKDTGRLLSYEEKIKFIEASNSLYKIIFYDGNFMFYNCRMAWNYRRLAELWCAVGNKEEGLKNLRLAEKAANEYDKVIDKDEQNYTSMFIDRCVFNKENTGKNWEGTETSMLYYRTTESVFDLLWDEPDFIDLQNRLKKQEKL